MLCNSKPSSACSPARIISRRISPPAQSAAQEQDAHLDLLCLGIDQVQTGYYFAGASAALYQEGRAQADEDARRIAAKATEILSGNTVSSGGLRWSAEAAVAQSDPSPP